MKTSVALLVFCCMLVTAGCNNKQKEEELQKQLSLAQNEQTLLQQQIGERDAYFEEMMRAVNDAYTNLEKARAKEAQVMQHEGGEGVLQFTNAETRRNLLQNVSDIGDALKENRKRIADLQSKAKSAYGEIAGLNELIDNMKKSLQEREQSIALLETRVKGLESEVNEKTQVIAVKDIMIDEQQKKLNTAYYVVGTRKELEEKGIIVDEGGFPWGLFGSTTVMSGQFDPMYFSSIDKTQDQTIHVGGEIDEILPRRSEDSFAIARPDKNSSDLTIVSPSQFWQDKYLVIVLD